eukprot:Opistho-2@66002
MEMDDRLRMASGVNSDAVAASLRSAGYLALRKQDEVDGRVFCDPNLPALPPHQRRQAYQSIAQCIAHLHSLDARAAGLGGIGVPGDYFQRSIIDLATAHNMSLSVPSAEAEAVVRWLAENAPMAESRAVLHGDLRIDSFVFHPTQPRVVGVSGWSCASLGHPLADLADFAVAFRMPHVGAPPFVAVSSPGVPEEAEFLRAYCTAADSCYPISGWNFYLALAFFKLAVKLQVASARAGRSSDAAAVVRHFVSLAGDSAFNRARDCARETTADASGVCPFAGRTTTTTVRVGRCPRDSLAHGVSPIAVSSFDTHPGDAKVTEHSAGVSHRRRSVASGAVPHSLFPFSERSLVLQSKVRAFVEKIILPAEKIYFEEVNSSPNRWIIPSIMETLKTSAKAQGLWNLFLPAVSGLSNLDYAPLAEIMGQSLIASEVFNCSAPDTGNMEVLHMYASDQQKQTWLEPLLRGDIRSCFAMTEPDVASSDATNMRCLARRDGSEWVISGRKWWSTGAGDPRCRLCIVMCITEDASDPTLQSRPRHGRHSMIIVPMDAPGVVKVRPLTVFGYDDAPHGHLELRFDNVRVPYANVILGPGRGFEIAQGRLGPGRIHHCMRAIGLGERCLSLMCQRVTERVAFGKPLARHGSIVQDIGKARVAIETARLLTLHAAHAMDAVGNKRARREIAMIKVYAPNAIIKLVDKAIQSFGAAGLCEDFPLAVAFAGLRSLRIADGPDEVHLASLGKDEIVAQIAKAKSHL